MLLIIFEAAGDDWQSFCRVVVRRLGRYMIHRQAFWWERDFERCVMSVPSDIFTVSMRCELTLSTVQISFADNCYHSSPYKDM